MAAQESPEPRDIYWFNTRVTQNARKRRRILVESFLALLYVFYVVPVTLLYLLLSVDSLTSYAGWIEYLYENVSYSLFILWLIGASVSCLLFLWVSIGAGVFAKGIITIYKCFVCVCVCVCIY